MTTKRTPRITTALAFGWLGLLLLACGCQHHSDAALQGRLVGTWRYAKSEGNQTTVSSDMTFTVASNGGFISRTTIPQTHSLKGTEAIKNGILIVTVTNRDNSDLLPPMVDRQTIIRFDESELVTISEGSSVKNYFRKLPTNY